MNKEQLEFQWSKINNEVSEYIYSLGYTDNSGVIFDDNKYGTFAWIAAYFERDIAWEANIEIDFSKINLSKEKFEELFPDSNISYKKFNEICKTNELKNINLNDIFSKEQLEKISNDLCRNDGNSLIDLGFGEFSIKINYTDALARDIEDIDDHFYSVVSEIIDNGYNSGAFYEVVEDREYFIPINERGTVDRGHTVTDPYDLYQAAFEEIEDYWDGGILGTRIENEDAVWGKSVAAILERNGYHKEAEKVSDYVDKVYSNENSLDDLVSIAEEKKENTKSEKVFGHDDLEK